MASVTGLTAEKMLELADENIVGASVVGNNLILTRRGGGTINAGNVRGLQGIQGVPGEVTDAELAAAVAALNLSLSNSGLGMLQVKQVDTEQFIPGFSPDTWKDITGLTWTHTFTVGRYLEVGVQLLLETEDPFGSDFDVQAIRVGGGSVCSTSGMVRRADHPIAISGSRKFLIPGTWSGPQTIKVQIRPQTGYNIYVKNGLVAGSLTFEDKGKP